ncbi:uncharacterized protein ACBT44_022219 [Syngnathus typhle]
MCDQQKKVKNKKTEGKSQEMKHHHSKQTHGHLHHRQKKFHQSDEDNQDTHSTAEDSLLSDHVSHRYHRKNRGQVSLSETSFTSSYGSSSTFSSSSTTASSSSSSSTSASSSSLSSENSSEGSEEFLLRRPQHSQSCNNISEKHKYIEEEEDTAPLIGTSGHPGKQKQAKGKSSHNGSKQGTRKKTRDTASFRKSKSMEALTFPSENEGNEEEQERRKNEIRKNLMKEKMKFSAFLNEITRQVLSPMRLTTLGVTDAQKPSGTESASSKSEDKRRHQRSRPVSADSVTSSQYSHSQLSKSNSSHHHRRHDSPDSPKSCADISYSERHPSWSQTSQHCSRSPSWKQNRRRNQGDIQRCHHSPSYHRYARDKSPHRHRRCYSPVSYSSYDDCDSSSYHHDKRSPHNHYEDDHDGGRYGTLTHSRHHDPANPQQSEDHLHHRRGYFPRRGGRHSPTYHHEEHHKHHQQIRNSSSQHHKDRPIKGHHHSNHLNTKRPTTPRHGNQAQNDKPKHHPGEPRDLAHHHGLKDQHHPNRQHGDQILQQNHSVHGHGRPHQRSKSSEFGDRHKPSHHHHGDDHKAVQQPDSQNSHQEHRYGAHHIPKRPHYHGDSPSHEDRHNSSHHGNHNSGILENHLGDSSHPEPHLHKHEPQHEETHRHIKGESAVRLPPHQMGVLSCKLDPTRKMNTTSGRDEEQTDFTVPSIPQEPTREMDKITLPKGENKGQSLLTSAVKMECFGDFLNSHKILEEELQRTRMELSNLTESFKILHENCSSTQQTNSLLEQKLNSVTKSMEGERQRLSQRISALTEQLTSAKYTNNVETFNVNSVLSEANDHFFADDTISQLMLPLAPPPAQFMDSQNYEKVKAAGQEQCLGSVPEEEESDWSEMGEEIPRFLLTNRNQAWPPREADVDKDSESEEILCLHSPRPLQVPHLKFTIHNEILPAPPGNACLSAITDESAFRMAASQNLGSTILIRSTSLEQIPLACHQMPKELRGTEAMMDLHHPGDEAIDDLDNEIIHHWRRNNDRDGRALEADSAPCSLQSVEQMLNQFMCKEPQSSEGICQRRSDMHGWTGGIAEEVLGGEQTQL